MTTSAPLIRIAVLAAGQASRFGASKLAQPVRGKPLLSYALEAAAQTCPDHVLVVTGADAETIMPICAAFSAEPLFNPDYRSGMGTSIAAAARACEGRADGMLLMLGDQPLVTASHLKDLIDHWNSDPQRICASRYSATLGPPALFGSAWFAQLAELQDDNGAKGLMTDSGKVTTVDFAPAAIDIDKLDDISELDKFLSGYE